MSQTRYGQMIDRKFIGLTGPEFECPIELGKLREFAKATNAFFPEYIDTRNAVVPPTFLSMAAYFWGYLLERPGDTVLAEIGADRMMSLDGGQSFVFSKHPPRAGEVLTAQACVEEILHKQGRTGGRLSIIRVRYDFRNSDGEIVAQWRPTSVVPEHPPSAGVAAAPSDGRWPFARSPTGHGQFAGIVPQCWEQLKVGANAGAIAMPPLTLTDIVRYQFASGEDSVAHYDHWAAQAEGFPTFFSVGMLHAGLLATYAVRWLGANNIRHFDSRFTDMIWPGDELTYEGEITGLCEHDGARQVNVALNCNRNRQSVTSATAIFHV